MSSTRRPQSSTDSPNVPDGNCVDNFSSCDFIVRIGHCSRMGDVCARTCGYCSESTTVAATTSGVTTSTLEPTAPGTSAPVTTTRATSTEITTSDAPNESSTTSTLPEAQKVIMIISDVPYSCDVQQLSRSSDGSFSFQQGDCVEYHLNE